MTRRTKSKTKTIVSCPKGVPKSAVDKLGIEIEYVCDTKDGVIYKIHKKNHNG